MSEDPFNTLSFGPKEERRKRRKCWPLFFSLTRKRKKKKILGGGEKTVIFRRLCRLWPGGEGGKEGRLNPVATPAANFKNSIEGIKKKKGGKRPQRFFASWLTGRKEKKTRCGNHFHFPAKNPEKKGFGGRKKGRRSPICSLH